MEPIERIFLPVDFSPGSQAAVDLALHLAQALGASITLFHAFDTPGGMVAIVPGATVEGDESAERKALEAKLGEIEIHLRDGGVTVADRIVATGPAERQILDHAQSGRFDLIVMGTHGRTGMPRLVLGSVAEYIVRHARCPVVTIHMPVPAAS